MKKGFVFMETLIVLVVLLISVVGMFGAYSKISSDIESRKYYDNITDLYKTDVIRSSVKASSLSSTNSFIEITPSNCTTYMDSSCGTILSSLKAEKIVINLKDINSLILSENNGLSNSMRSYLRTINTNEKSNRYIIVNYKYNDKNYYASLKI